ncbi:UDP-3-O-(3-hydroxymyristoyl)glucosamine N-acyltransferase [Flexibacterium corallicola]|uniref:UDP-3-O-(3-hydroxymyristoyl)glucosamine N-acyltransferase n=1 Tax=Flexibacterium corallicola TaxID=3037259 RepID=UPI00286ED1A1|nr:UDP-3-O-(3-hydroxymyristoyl)glucosamine N-acyltransferase [Pseudovibrio sp. M1P-2-3]
MSEHNFYDDVQSVTISQIAQWADAQVIRGDSELCISGVAPLDEGGEGKLVFIDNPKYLPQLKSVEATACLVAQKYLDKVPDNVIPLLSKEPYRALAKVMAHLYPQAMQPMVSVAGEGIHPKATVASTAKIAGDVLVEAGAVIGDGAVIASGCHIAANAVIGANSMIGEGSRIGANSVIQHSIIGERVIIHPNASIGQDGFGFAMGAGGHLKVPQIGSVVISDDVEIGAGTTIDRGANRDTIIGQGTKIDNQVQIGHNVNIGKHCIIVSQVGISGSTTLQDYVAIGGQTGVGGHVTIGMGAQVAAVSSVNDDLPAGGRYGGTPAKPVRQWFRELAAIKRLVEKNEDKKS